MIRIIGGSFRSRMIETPKTETTKPTKNSCREGIFNALNMRIPGSIVLDLFAGSGAYGIECISRGADYVYFNDANTYPVEIIKKNTKMLNITNYEVANLDFKAYLESCIIKKQTFDIVFIDPPYALDCYYYIVNKILNNSLLRSGGVIVLETNGVLDFSFLNDVKIKEYKYGYSKVYMIKK